MFITLEGPEGSGKSTQQALLAQYLQEEGYAVVSAREPGGTAIGDQVRDCLHDVRNSAMEPQTEFLLYSASRAQLVREVLLPALDDGKLVICDRYADSSLAYQGYGRGLDLNELRRITRFTTGGLIPDLTFLLDIDVQQGLLRRVSAEQEMNRLDLETVAFHERVRKGYHRLAAGDSRWVIVDAARDSGEVQADLLAVALERLRERADPAQAGD